MYAYIYRKGTYPTRIFTICFYLDTFIILSIITVLSTKTFFQIPPWNCETKTEPKVAEFTDVTQLVFKVQETWLISWLRVLLVLLTELKDC